MDNSNKNSGARADDSPGHPLATQWPAIRRLAVRTRRTSLAFSIASVDQNGHPWVTPIGSLMFDRDRPRAVYFELLTQRLSTHLDQDPRVVVLGVDSGKWLWLKSFLSGRFSSPPGVRLVGKALPRRAPTNEEIQRWYRITGVGRKTRGGRMLWTTCRWAREIEFESIEPVSVGPMTRGLWS